MHVRGLGYEIFSSRSDLDNAFNHTIGQGEGSGKKGFTGGFEVQLVKLEIQPRPYVMRRIEPPEFDFYIF